ncbi:MAG TPA: hypothetical protein VFQ61_03285 [Polyangiaceae bacterium]|nr:hypothetical protein [Polyangiaceae bacterium]
MTHAVSRFRSGFLGVSAVGWALSAALGCAREPVMNEYPVAIQVDANPDEPLAGVGIWSGSQKMGVTGPEGRAVTVLEGLEGQVFSLRVACPEGHREATQPLAIALHTVADGDPAPLYQARCEPLQRSVVVAVRAERGPNLPLLYLGREVARTDSAGSAHVLLKGASEDSIELTLDTSGSPELRPRSPSTRFEVPGNDDLLVFNQAFTLPPAPKAAPKARPTGIVNIKR